MEADEVVIGWYGRMGSGKTLNMTKWALYLAEQTNRKVYANYHLNHPQAMYFSDFSDIWEHVEDAIICWDEIGQDHDGRNSLRTDWTAKRQQEFTYWFLQSRKRKCSFFYSTQRLNMIEKRVRENTQFIFHCTKNRFWNTMYEKLYDCEEWGFEGAIELRKFTTEKPQVYYGYYNTHEITQKSFIKA